MLWVLFFLLGVWLARNGANEANEVSRSEVQHQPKRAPARRRLGGRIRRSSLEQNDGPTRQNINNAFSKKRRRQRLPEVVSALCFVERACTPDSSMFGAANETKASAKL
jgi:hypothetical protein